MPVLSNEGGYPEGYQKHLPPEADVNQEAMRRAAEADEAARREEEADESEAGAAKVETATAKPGTKSK